MKITDILPKYSDQKPVKGFSVVLNQVGKKYNYNNTGFVFKGALVLDGDKLPLGYHTVLNTASEDLGELYARR